MSVGVQALRTYLGCLLDFSGHLLEQNTKAKTSLILVKKQTWKIISKFVVLKIQDGSHKKKKVKVAVATGNKKGHLRDFPVYTIFI